MDIKQRMIISQITVYEYACIYGNISIRLIISMICIQCIYTITVDIQRIYSKWNYIPSLKLEKKL